MRKFVSLVLAIMLIGTLAYAQNQQQGRGQRRGGGQGMNRMVFGISQKDYQSLGLTEEQQTKINELQKAYNEKYMMKPGQQGQKKSAEEMKKLTEERNKASEQLLKDFKSVLTEDQLKAYETAYKAQIEKTKTQLTKQYAAITQKLSFTDEQNTKLAELIKKFDGNQMTFNENFLKLLTDEQKTAYTNYQKEQREQMMKNKGGQQGQNGPGGFKPDFKPDQQPDGQEGENGEMMPPPDGFGGGDGEGPDGFKPDFKPDFQPDAAP